MPYEKKLNKQGGSLNSQYTLLLISVKLWPRPCHVTSKCMTTWRFPKWPYHPRLVCNWSRPVRAGAFWKRASIIITIPIWPEMTLDLVRWPKRPKIRWTKFYLIYRTLLKERGPLYQRSYRPNLMIETPIFLMQIGSIWHPNHFYCKILVLLCNANVLHLI